MHKELIEFNKSQRKGKNNFRAGDVVRVHRKIIEGGKTRIQIFEGMIIVVRGLQSSSPMITVRKMSGDVGVEIVVPIFTPQIEKIERIKRAKVRRANLGYVRTKSAKKLRFKFSDLDDEKSSEGAVEEKKDGEKTVNKDGGDKIDSSKKA